MPESTSWSNSRAPSRHKESSCETASRPTRSSGSCVAGVDVASGFVQGLAQLVGADGTVSSFDGLGATVGGNWITDAWLNPFSLVAGHAPDGTGQAVLDQRTAREQEWVIGDSFTVLAKGAPVELTLVGIATFGSLDGLPGSTFVAVQDTVAEHLFAEPGEYDVIQVAAADGISARALARASTRHWAPVRRCGDRQGRRSRKGTRLP